MSKQKRKRTSRREHPANPSQHLATDKTSTIGNRDSMGQPPSIHPLDTDDDESTPTTQTNTPRNVKGSGVNPLVIAGACVSLRLSWVPLS